MWSSTIPLLLISILVSVQSPIVCQTREKCTTAPLRENLEKILGKPVEAPAEGPIRYYNGHYVTVKFSASETAEILVINGSEGIDDLHKLLNQLVPKSSRGRFIERGPGKIERGPGKTFRQNWKIYVEEYECLTIEYSEKLCCLNSVPAAVRITWKATSNNGAPAR